MRRLGCQSAVDRSAESAIPRSARLIWSICALPDQFGVPGLDLVQRLKASSSRARPAGVCRTRTALPSWGSAARSKKPFRSISRTIWLAAWRVTPIRRAISTRRVPSVSMLPSTAMWAR